ncbi:MAG TPA: GNAT family N-acetyltransferase [Dehalococcoidia bacterium]|nr:GNAT family N-acetyltransferase [Dehalococcoidia bacterium]
MIKLEKPQIKPASRILARAFRDDPVMEYAFPENGGNDPRMPYAYELMLRLGVKYGYTYATSSALEGVATWDRFYNPGYSFWRTLLSGSLVPAMRMGWDAGKRMQKFADALKEKQQEIVSGIHWYLQLIGVEPEQQGKGFASQLIREMLHRIDKEGLPCYLETELEENVPIYEHFGFQTIEEYRVPDTPLRMWLMLRPASPD